MSFWINRRVLVTGGTGFLGSFVVDALKQAGCKHVFVPHRDEYDLRETVNVIRLYETSTPEVVIHLAATVGGIGVNRARPGTFFYDNAIMGIQMIEYARRYHVQKFVGISTVCAYPKFTPVPFKEEDLWNGYPEETNAAYGLSKKMQMVQLQAYRQEFDFTGITLVPVNLYGPRDNFDLEASHVIPALIRKCVEAKRRNESSVVVWGSGNATREFLYVKDAAEAIVVAAEKFEKPDPVNIGTGTEISIRDLAAIIKELTRFEGAIEWDATKPDGQPRRCLDTSRALREFGWQAKTPFNDGIQQTIEWFENQYKTIGSSA